MTGSAYHSELSWQHKLSRSLWNAIWLLLFFPSPRCAFGWRRFILRVFGATVEKGVKVYGSTKFYYPANVTLGENCIVGPWVDLYSVDNIMIDRHAVVSQYSHLCTATHDYQNPSFALITKPINIGTNCWVCTGAFIGPGVTMAKSAVVAAHSVVCRDVAENQVVGGNPAVYLKERHTTGVPPSIAAS